MDNAWCQAATASGALTFPLVPTADGLALTMSALRTAGAAILTSEATAELARRLLGNLRERARATPPATRPKNGHSNGRKHG